MNTTNYGTPDPLNMVTLPNNYVRLLWVSALVSCKGICLECRSFLSVTSIIIFLYLLLIWRGIECFWKANKEVLSSLFCKRICICMCMDKRHVMMSTVALGSANARNFSFKNSQRWPICIINSVNKTNYLVVPPQTMQQDSLFRN